MSGVFYHSVIHDLGFFICLMIYRSNAQKTIEHSFSVFYFFFFIIFFFSPKPCHYSDVDEVAGSGSDGFVAPPNRMQVATFCASEFLNCEQIHRHEHVFYLCRRASKIT